MQDSFGFSFSKIFVYDVSKEKLICFNFKLFASLVQDHKVMRDKDICPKFFDGADHLRFQTQYQAE